MLTAVLTLTLPLTAVLTLSLSLAARNNTSVAELWSQPELIWCHTFSNFYYKLKNCTDDNSEDVLKV